MRINLKSAWEGRLTTSNKVGRVDKLKPTRFLIGLGRLGLKDACQDTKARSSWASSQRGFSVGRQLRYVCNDLNALIYKGGNPDADSVRRLCDKAIRALDKFDPPCFLSSELLIPVPLCTSSQTSRSKEMRLG